MELIHAAIPTPLSSLLSQGQTPLHHLDLDSSLSLYAYVSPIPDSSTFFFIHAADVFSDRPVGQIAPEECKRIQNKTSITIAMAKARVGKEKEAVKQFVSSMNLEEMNWSLIRGKQIKKPIRYFAEEYSQKGLLVLPPVSAIHPIQSSTSSSSSSSPLLLLSALQQTINFNSLSSYRSLADYLQQAPALLGLNHTISPYLHAHHSHYIRTCRQAYQVKYGLGEIMEGSLTFWRPLYEQHVITGKHDQLWNLFMETRKVSRLVSFQELTVIQEWWQEEENALLVLAIPQVERVECSLVFADQAIYQDLEQRSRYFRLSEKPIGTHRRTVIRGSDLDKVTFSETSRVYRYGDSGLVFWQPTVEMNKVFRGLDMKARVQQMASSQSSRSRLLAEGRRGEGDEEKEKRVDVDNINQQQSSTSSSTTTFSSRRLADTYAESLIYTNLQFIRRFGTEDRRVPGHMPHLLQRSVLYEIEREFGDLVNHTIANRFRSRDDLQFSFTYFHWLRAREQTQWKTRLEKVWKTMIDADGDGELNEREFENFAQMICLEEHYNL